jgi:hypothetical protein
VLAVLLFGAHATIRWWGTALVQVLWGDIPTLADAPPLVWALAVGWVVLSLAGGMVIGLLVIEGSGVRDRYRWQQEQTLQRQRRELEQQLREESLPDWQREVIRERRQREAEITGEARRRLALLEEEADG